MLIFDFRNSPEVGDGPNNTASHNRSKSHVSVFNLTAEYRDNIDQPLQRIYFIVVSNTQSHDAYATVSHILRCQKSPEAAFLLKRSHHEFKCDGASININGEVSKEFLIDFPDR